MNDELVEREARALYVSHYADKPNLGWERETETFRGLFRELARDSKKGATS